MSANSANITSSGFAVVQSTETGKAYLVNTDVTVSKLTSIENTADKMSNSVVINSANTNTNLQVTGLVKVTYKAYAVDAAKNLSTASLDNVTIGGLVDIDGNVYRTVVIGNQHWIAENLKVKQYRDGINITHIDIDSNWSNNTNGAYGYYYNNTANRDTYGMLYNGYAVDNSSGLCPQGWHVPSKTEFNTLKSYLVQSGDNAFVLKLREEGTDHWSGDPQNASNSSGFTALGSGYRSSTSGAFLQLKTYAYWWTCCANNQPYYVAIANSGTTSYVSLQVSKKYGFAVRCLKDN